MGGEIFKQYKLLVQDSAKLSDRRQTINTIYLSANSILLGAVALLAAQSGVKAGIVLLPAVLIALAGIPLCLDWRKLVLNYKRLLDLRFAMLRQIELLPDFTFPIKIYNEESTQLYSKEKVSQRVLFGFSRVEVNIPLVFIALYIITIVGALVLAYPNIVSQLHTWGILPR